MEFITKSAGETKKLGEKIGSDLKGGKTFALVGDLGSGKTTFVQGLAKGLGIKQRIISPTFILLRRYEIRDRRYGKRVANRVLRFSNFYHIDLYRLEGDIEKELVNLGFDEIISDPANIVAIEWADKGKKVIPDDTLWIEFTHSSKNERKIQIRS